MRGIIILLMLLCGCATTKPLVSIDGKIEDTMAGFIEITDAGLDYRSDFITQDFVNNEAISCFYDMDYTESAFEFKNVKEYVVSGDTICINCGVNGGTLVKGVYYGGKEI